MRLFLENKCIKTYGFFFIYDYEEINKQNPYFTNEYNPPINFRSIYLFLTKQKKNFYDLKMNRKIFFILKFLWKKLRFNKMILILSKSKEFISKKNKRNINNIDINQNQ